MCALATINLSNKWFALKALSATLVRLRWIRHLKF
jgi:hypothetical protein